MRWDAAALRRPPSGAHLAAARPCRRSARDLFDRSGTLQVRAVAKPTPRRRAGEQSEWQGVPAGERARAGTASTVVGAG